MNNYIVFNKAATTPGNEVWFESSLLDALETRDRLTEETQGFPQEWAVAEVFDDSGWFGRFLRWLRSKLS